MRLPEQNRRFLRSFLKYDHVASQKATNNLGNFRDGVVGHILKAQCQSETIGGIGDMKLLWPKFDALFPTVHEVSEIFKKENIEAAFEHPDHQRKEWAEKVLATKIPNNSNPLFLAVQRKNDMVIYDGSHRAIAAHSRLPPSFSTTYLLSSLEDDEARSIGKKHLKELHEKQAQEFATWLGKLSKGERKRLLLNSLSDMI